MIWMFVFLAGLLLTKYYTETAVRNLRTKTREQQKSLNGARHALTNAQERLMEVEKEEKNFKARIDRLQTVIVDIQVEINESIVRARAGTSTGTDAEGK